MKSVSERFVLDPEAFMKDNIVLQCVHNDTEGLIDVVVKEGGGHAKIHNRQGGKVCIMMQKGKSDLPSLRTYFCPYNQNELKSTTLGNDALFMFTPTMDGCTLGIGSDAGNGVQRVTHANCARGGASAEAWGIEIAREQQAKLQKNLLISQLGQTLQLISPNMYTTTSHGGRYKSTTFGVHGFNMTWEFYTLKYAKLSQLSYIHGGVDRVV